MDIKLSFFAKHSNESKKKKKKTYQKASYTDSALDVTKSQDQRPILTN